MLRRTALAASLGVFALFVALLVPGSVPRRWFLSWVTGPATAVEPLGESQSGPPNAAVLRVAIGAMTSPERTFVHYGSFFAALAAHRGERLELLQRTTYREVNELLGEGAVDLAWICTGAWPELESAQTARLVAVPVMYGKTTYQSFLIAGKSTNAHDLAGLRGARFAFTDPLSLTGRLWPLRRIRELGGSGEGYFVSTIFTHGHDLSIEAVRRGLVDAASVDSLVYRFLADRYPAEVEGIRVLERSPDFPVPPLVLSGSLAVARAAALRNDLFALAASREGRAILHELAVDDLVPADPAAYRTLP